MARVLGNEVEPFDQVLRLAVSRIARAMRDLDPVAFEIVQEYFDQRAAKHGTDSPVETLLQEPYCVSNHVVIVLRYALGCVTVGDAIDKYARFLGSRDHRQCPLNAVERESLEAALEQFRDVARHSAIEERWR